MLEEEVPHAEGLVDDEDLGLDRGLQGKGQPHHHAAGVRLDRLLDEIANVGKAGDLVEARINFTPGKSHHGAVEVDVLPPGELGVEAAAELEEGGDPALDAYGAFAGLQGAGNDLEEGGLAGAVAADDADGLAAADLEADIAQGVEVTVALAGFLAQVLTQPARRQGGGGGVPRADEPARRALPDAIGLADVLDGDDGSVGHHEASNRTPGQGGSGESWENERSIRIEESSMVGWLGTGSSGLSARWGIRHFATDATTAQPW